MPFDLFQLFLPEQLGVLLRHKGAFSGDGIEESLLLQLVIGPLGSDNADAEILCQPTDGGQRLILGECAGNDLLLELGIDLFIDGCAAFIVDE